MNQLDYQLTLTLFSEKKCFGPGPMMLLKGVEDTGSLQKSAAKMGMAYSKAWNMVRELEEIWGFSLLYRRSGGENGGGSTLTKEGKTLLQKYEAMLTDIEKSAENSFQKHFG